MPKKKSKGRKITKKLLAKNRLVILNEESFEEVFSLRLTWMNVFIVATLGAILIIFVTTYIIAFTPLREYIPGYSSASLKKEATRLMIQSDSLSKEISNQKAYVEALQRVFRGEDEIARFNKDSIKPVIPQLDPKEIEPSKEEIALRESVQKDEQFSISASKIDTKTSMFNPVDGTIIQAFDPNSGFNGIQYRSLKSSAVKAVMNGVVLYKTWTAKDGYTLVVRHSDDWTSILKGMREVMVTEKDKVKSGQALGISGDLPITFELWKTDTPVNPQSYLNL